MSEKLQELLKLKSGGVYVPPAKLKALMADVELEQESEESQKLQWETLKKKINSIINRVNKENIKILVIELFKLNLFRGRGALCKSIMNSQQLSTAYTDVYSSLVSVLNSKIPEVGSLLIRRLIVKYKILLRREDKEGCRAVVVFLSDLVIFHVCCLDLVMEIVLQLLQEPNDFRVEMVLEILITCGVELYDNESAWFDTVRNTLRNILSEDIVDSRSQFLIQSFFDTFNKKVEEEQAIDEDLDLVEESDCVVHKFSLKDRIQGDDQLDVFQYDKDYKQHNEKYNLLRKEILGSDVESEAEEEVDDNSDFSSDNEEDDKEEDDKETEDSKKLTVQIKDLTEQELTNYQKNVYLTVMSSMSPEEATHKLLRLPSIDPSRKEYMLVDMIVKCCAQEKVYSKYYGIIGECLIVLSKAWSEAFQRLFKENYENCYKFETALLRNIGAFWGHMLASDKLGWECLSVVKLTEQDTTSSGRIFLKFVFLKILQENGINHLVERIEEPYLEPFVVGIFPKTDAENLRFSINFFTAIGLGKLTERMRDSLENLAVEAEAIADVDDDSNSSRGRSRSRSSSYSSYSSSRSGSYSRSRSASRSASPDGKEVENRGRGMDERSRSRSPSNRDRSFSRSRRSSPARRPLRGQSSIPRGPRSYRGRGYSSRGSGYRGNRGRGYGGYSNNRGGRGYSSYNGYGSDGRKDYQQTR
ncbi:hypothetical protein PMKS-002696 [Pichia membranifaciens]|uniref:Pre-mRNA-splicing factor CWC22 n=1 Tax=Pichia membranifaciens TaxID=4926 RepID=A0A1Q2YI46_9ASCO|nr:hypothetical protein PMKS-002696 [Pichia membranifaciens]